MTNVFAMVNCTLDDSVSVRNFNCADGKVLISIEHEHENRGHDQYAQISPARARIIADALNMAADQLDAEQHAGCIDVDSWEVTCVESHHLIALGPSS